MSTHLFSRHNPVNQLERFNNFTYRTEALTNIRNAFMNVGLCCQDQEITILGEDDTSFPQSIGQLIFVRCAK